MKRLSSIAILLTLMGSTLALGDRPVPTTQPHPHGGSGGGGPDGPGGHGGFHNQEFTQEDFDAAVKFIDANEPIRSAQLKARPDFGGKPLRMMIVSHWRNMQHMKETDDEHYQNKLLQLKTEDQIVGFEQKVKDKTLNSAEQADLATQIGVLEDLRLAEKKIAIDRMKKATATIIAKQEQELSDETAKRDANIADYLQKTLASDIKWLEPQRRGPSTRPGDPSAPPGN